MKEPSRDKALLTLHVTTETHFFLRKNLKPIMHGRVKMYVMRLFVGQHFYFLWQQAVWTSSDKQANVIDAFYTNSRYLDDILNIINVSFDNMVSQIYPSEL